MVNSLVLKPIVILLPPILKWKKLKIKFSQIERNELSRQRKAIMEATINAKKKTLCSAMFRCGACCSSGRNGENCAHSGATKRKQAYPSGFMCERKESQF